VGGLFVSEKRYQVFVSATYSDLQSERHLLTQILPTLGCLPCGLELNPSAIGAWSAIKRLIDESDYYLLLVGSRYGSLSPSGVSFTHMEYVYATTKQKPILVLMHEAPEARPVELQEQTPEGRLKLRDFRQLIQRGLTAPWSDERSLEMTLRQQLPELIRARPMPGWVRANQISNPQLERENQALVQRLEELERERDEWLGKGDDLGQLAQGRDIVDVSYRCKAYAAGNCEEVAVRSQLPWNALFLSFAPYMSQPQHEDFMAAKLAERVQETALKDVQASRPKTHAVTDIALAPLCFNTIKIQFRTLGLIRRVPRPEDARVWWQLTTAGEKLMTTLMAVRKSAATRSV
jgi:hypothetical protein